MTAFEKRYNDLKSRIFSIKDDADFDQVAFDVYLFQYEFNTLYKRFADLTFRSPDKVSSVSELPFLPIEFFKNKTVISGTKSDNAIEFRSSGTGNMGYSSHFLNDLDIYRKSYTLGFKQFYGDIKDWTIFALLPGYLERGYSSLVNMVKGLIDDSGNSLGGFFLDDHAELNKRLIQQKAIGGKTLLIGVTFGLLDFAENYQPDLSDAVVMETGGMKGRREELLREEVHEILNNNFNTKQIHSEYGMTELCSQAYSEGNGIFRTPGWMKVRIRDTYDPFSPAKTGKTGGINVIDLANLHSCSFIETQDLGRIKEDESFEVMGRFDQSDIRGCNLMVI